MSFSKFLAYTIAVVAAIYSIPPEYVNNTVESFRSDLAPKIHDTVIEIAQAPVIQTIMLNDYIPLKVQSLYNFYILNNDDGTESNNPNDFIKNLYNEKENVKIEKESNIHDDYNYYNDHVDSNYGEEEEEEHELEKGYTHDDYYHDEDLDDNYELEPEPEPELEPEPEPETEPEPVIKKEPITQKKQPKILKEAEEVRKMVAEATILQRRGNINGALDLLDSAIQKDPSSSYALMVRGVVYLSQDRLANALVDFSRMIDNDIELNGAISPASAMAYFYRSKSSSKMGDLKEAYSDIQKYFELLEESDSSSNAFTYKNEAQELRSQLLLGLNWLTSLNSALPKNFPKEEKDFYDIMLDDKKILEIGKIPDVVSSDISELIRIAPQSAILRLTRSLIRLKNKDYTLSITDLLFVSRVQPSNTKVHLLIGRIKISAQDYDGAYESFADCRKLDADNKQCKKLWRSTKNFKKALDEVKQAIKLELYKKVERLLGNGDIESSSIYELAKDLNSESAIGSIYSVACVAHSKLPGGTSGENQSETLKYCNKAIAVNKEDIEALLTRGEIQLDIGDYDEASEDFNVVLKLEDINGSHGKAQEFLQKVERSRRMGRDYYKVLGVSRKASDKDIRKAYRKLSKEWHPDKYSGDLPKDKVEKKMSDINEAYEVLSKPELREKFDSGIDPNNQQQQQGRPGEDFFGGFGGGFPGGGFGGFPFGGGQGGHGGHARGHGGGNTRFFFQQDGDPNVRFKMHFP